MGLEEDIEYLLFNERKVLCLQGKLQFFPTLHWCFQNHDHLFFVMELIDGGDLSHHLMELGRFSERQSRYVLLLIYVCTKRACMCLCVMCVHIYYAGYITERIESISRGPKA